jgi:surface protein
VGQVTDMGWMFKGAAAFNQPLADWDVSQVTNMNCMFRDAAAFDPGPELDAWVHQSWPGEPGSPTVCGPP